MSASRRTSGVESGSGIRAMMSTAAQIPDAIHLEVGQPDWDPPAGVHAANVRASEGRMSYTPSLGIPELREAVAARTSDRTGLAIDAEMVAITPGAVCAVASMALLCSERLLLVPEATWPNYMLMPAISGASLIHYPLVDQLPDLDFLQELDVDGALLVLNTPANPTGAVVGEGLMQGLLELAQSRRWWVLADEIYEDLVWAGEFARAAAITGSLERLAVVSGVSKSFAMTGYRVGWLVAEASIIARVEPLLEALVSCASSASQLASVAALDEPPEYLDGVRARLAERAATVAEVCMDSGMLAAAPRAGMYAWLDLGQRADDANRFALDLLREEGVAIAPGTAFGPGGVRHARIALTGSPDTLEIATTKLVRFWGAYG